MQNRRPQERGPNGLLSRREETATPCPIYTLFDYNYPAGVHRFKLGFSARRIHCSIRHSSSMSEEHRDIDASVSLETTWERSVKERRTAGK